MMKKFLTVKDTESTVTFELGRVEVFGIVDGKAVSDRCGFALYSIKDKCLAAMGVDKDLADDKRMAVAILFSWIGEMLSSFLSEPYISHINLDLNCVSSILVDERTIPESHSIEQLYRNLCDMPNDDFVEIFREANWLSSPMNADNFNSGTKVYDQYNNILIGVIDSQDCSPKTFRNWFYDVTVRVSHVRTINMHVNEINLTRSE